MTKTNMLVIAATALLLTSCTTAQQRVDQQLAQDIASCTQGELTPANALQRRNCVDQATISRLQAVGATNMPLVYQLVNANHAAAVEYSEGKISKDNYNSILRQNTDYFNNLTNAQNAADGDTMTQRGIISGLCALSHSAALSCYSNVMSGGR